MIFFSLHAASSFRTTPSAGPDCRWPEMAFMSDLRSDPLIAHRQASPVLLGSFFLADVDYVSELGDEAEACGARSSTTCAI